MISKHEAVIVSAARTPMGSFSGVLSSVPATKLGSIAIAETVKRIGLPGDRIDEVLIGCVLSAGLGQAPARQAAIGAGLPHSVGAVTVTVGVALGVGLTVAVQLGVAVEIRSRVGLALKEGVWLGEGVGLGTARLRVR